jgi:hypothetical protein
MTNETSNKNDAINKKAKTAYLLNLFLPGNGNIHFGQNIIGLLIFFPFLITVLFLFFIQSMGKEAFILLFILLIIMALPTFGLSLIAIPLLLLEFIEFPFDDSTFFFILFFIWFLFALISNLLVLARKYSLLAKQTD